MGPVFLTGMMASGKSTVGRLLAQEAGAVFVDLDERIERIFGRTTAQLFAESEAHFRRCERAALRSLLAEPGFAEHDVVVAAGGGTVVDERNRDAMAQLGTIVFLDLPLDDLVARLEAAQETDARPLVADAGLALRGRLAHLMNARRSAYRDRALVVDGRGEPETVAARVQALIAGSDPGPSSEAVGAP